MWQWPCPRSCSWWSIIDPVYQHETHKWVQCMRGSRKFCQRGSNFDVFFCCCFFSWWREVGSKHLSSCHCWPASETPFKCWWPNIECWLSSFVILRGFRPVLLRNPIILWFFRRGSGPPVSLDLPMQWQAGETQAKCGISLVSFRLWIILTICMLGNFSCFCCRLLTFFKINFFKKIISKTLISVKWFGSRLIRANKGYIPV